MNHQIRRVATSMLVLFAILFINLNLIQLVRGESLANNDRNRRLLEREYEIDRGAIVVGDREVVRSVPTDGELKYLREYLEPSRYAHLTGYYSFILGRAGIENAVNEELTGAPSDALAENLTSLLVGRDPVGNTVRLTIDPQVQAAAQTALGGTTGAVVVVNPQTGAIIASYSNPSYDPNRLSSHVAADVLASWSELTGDPAQPLLDRATRETYPPGSTFKLVTAAAALERGMEPTTALTNRDSYTPPQTSVAIPNFSPGNCGDGGTTISLADALRVSCNTVFAELAVELGPDALVDVATRLGYNREIPYELPVAVSRIPGDLDPPATAQSGIGQRDVRITPLHAALIVAGIVNDGVIMRPHVVADVLDSKTRPLRGPDERPWSDDSARSQAISSRTAEQLRRMMIDVVDRGTGTRAAISGVTVGGKTGTAEDPSDDTPTAWFVGFAGDEIAIAVVVPDAGGGGGGTVAAPIAKAVMEAALN